MCIRDSAWVVWLRERVGYHAGQHIRFAIRRQVLDRLQQAGPAWIQGKPEMCIRDRTLSRRLLRSLAASAQTLLATKLESNAQVMAIFFIRNGTKIAAPKRNITIMSNVNKIFLRSAGSFHAFLKT